MTSSVISFAYFTHFSKLNMSGTNADICKRSTAFLFFNKLICDTPKTSRGKNLCGTLSSPPLAFTASKHGEQLLNEFFIYSEGITPSLRDFKGLRIFKMTACTIGSKSVKELSCNTLKNHKLMWFTFVASRSMRSIDRKLVFL